MAMQYHAVAIGRKPGLYSNREDALQQTDCFPGSQLQTFASQNFAADYVRNVGRVPNSDIRIYKRDFTAQGVGRQQPYSFQEEFDFFASSQQLSWQQRKRAHVNAIRDEIIYHYLPEGLLLGQLDDSSGDIKLNEDQTLRVYQAMCRQLGKQPQRTIVDCRAELKRAPYVNILDFVDMFRTQGPVRTFYDPITFFEYTRRKPVHLGYAMESEFLAALLQDLSHLRHNPQHYGRRLQPQVQRHSSPVLPHLPLPAETLIRSESSGDSDMGFQFSSHQSHLGLPPLSPASDCSSSSFSYRDASSSRSTSPVPGPSTPLSSHDSSTLSHFTPKTTLSFPKPAQTHDCDVSDFLEDDDEIATQLSQQLPPAELAPEILEDIIQDDEEIFTQLTQEWPDAAHDIVSRNKTPGKRRRESLCELDNPAKCTRTMHGTRMWSSAPNLLVRAQ